MNDQPKPVSRIAETAPLIDPAVTYASLGDAVTEVVLKPGPRPLWRPAFLGALGGFAFFLYALGYLFMTGVGIWGINIPVAWGFAIANYVWWIGIGMAGTFISSALLLARQPWRSALNRSAETMTVFAVSVAGVFPIMHLGRPWFFYWLFPYPDKMNLWPQWRSSLLWDFFAILAYLVVSILIWYVGMIPDLAALRDRARSRVGQWFYGLLALGWRGEARHWQQLDSLLLMLGGLGVPLVFSVHSMVALDFSEGLPVGWHSSLFPPFFVAGALYSGFALVLAIGIPMRRLLGLEGVITARHLDKMAKILLASALLMGYSYATENFMHLYSGEPAATRLVLDRIFGFYAPLYWTVITCNVLIPQALWLRAVRLRPMALFAVSVAVVFGMWLERVVLVVAALYHGFTPSEWGAFVPTPWDWFHLLGSGSLFALLFLLFIRLGPSIALFETRRMMYETGHGK